MSSDSAPSAASTFPTRDLLVSAHLKTLGYEPQLSPCGSRSVTFTFDSDASLLDHVSAFARGEARVEPLAFDAAKIELRRAIALTLRAARSKEGGAA
jgi:hypothetical protein